MHQVKVRQVVSQRTPLNFSRYSKEKVTEMNDKYPGNKTLMIVFTQTGPKNIETSHVHYDKIKKVLGEDEGGKADIDYIELKETFNDNEHVFVEKVPMPSKTEIESYFKTKIGKVANEYDKFMFVFLTYKGDKDGLIHVADTPNYYIKEVFDILKTPDLIHIRGKPKLFLIQADDIYLIPGMKEFHNKGYIETKIIPSDTDRLVITSNIPQRFDDESKPSLLIQAFCEVMKKWRKSDDSLNELMVNSLNELMVNITDIVKTHIEQMENVSGAGKLDLPLVHSSLTRFWKID
ncbi:hypothetical protein ACF0H5_011017 [Mactra antiquata]